MSSSPFRWRLPNRKSSVPFFPGAWPNNSAHESIATRNNLIEPTDLTRTERAKQQSSAMTTDIPSNSRVGTSGGSNEPLQHIGSIADFQLELSLSRDHLRADSVASVAAEVDNQSQHNTTDSRTDTISSLSVTTIGTPSLLSPTTSLSLPPIITSDQAQQRKQPSFLPRMTTQQRTSNNPNEPYSLEAYSFTNHSTSINHDPPATFVPGLPPLSLPPHTLVFSPESVASYFTSSEQSSRSTLDIATATSPPAPSSPLSSPPSPLTKTSAFTPDRPALPEIASLPGFATSFYPVLDSENRVEGIHGLLSPATTSSSREYDNDSPVLPSDDEASPGFLSPFLSSQKRSGISPSSAEMDAFGLAVDQVSNYAPSEVSIPTSFRSQIGAELESRTPSFTGADDTLRADNYRRRNASSPSLSLSLSFIGTTNSVGSQEDVQGGDLTLRRQQRRSEPPLSLPLDRHGIPLTTTITSSAVSVHAHGPGKLSSLQKMKRLGGKIKNFFVHKNKDVVESPDPQIGMTRTTQVTHIEYASEHPIPLPDARRGKMKSIPSAVPAFNRNRRQSLPVLSRTSPSVSRPKALRPTSFLSTEADNEVNNNNRLSSSKLADLIHAMGSKVGSMSSMHLSGASPNMKELEEQPSTPIRPAQTKGKAVERPLVSAPSSSRQEHRRRTYTAPAAATSPPKNPRRFSLSSGLGNSKLELMRVTVTPHPPLPQTLRETLPLRSESQGEPRSPSRSVVVPVRDTKSHGASTGANSSRMVKARSMVVGRTHSRKAVPALDDIELANGVAGFPTAGQAGSPNGRSPIEDANYQREENESPPTYEPPLLHRAFPVTEHALSQTNKRRSRGFSFTSTVSKRAQKARSMIVGRSEPGTTKLDVPRRILYNRNDASDTRGSSLGCADYEPDLVLDSMSFAQKPEPPSSGVSESEVVLDRDTPGEKTVCGVVNDDPITVPTKAERAVHHTSSLSGNATNDRTEEIYPSVPSFAAVEDA